ncbi:MAG TPA: rhodanese-like domain-containing protein [Candidatus Merdenecus merdavium]|nr:rhodanese-like domain-containing protein [Candidatus Merdenecus merdavium]
MKRRFVTGIITLLCLFTGCSNSGENSDINKKPIESKAIESKATESQGINETTESEEGIQEESFTEDQDGQVVASDQNITPEELKTMMDEGKDYILIDIRTREKYDTGYIPGAVQVDLPELEGLLQQGMTNKKETDIVVYGDEENNSKEALELLLSLGYSKTRDLGDVSEWPYELTTVLEDLNTIPDGQEEPGVG